MIPLDDPLNPDEVAALTAFAVGLTFEAAARRLDVGSSTVRRQQRAAADKLHAVNVTHAVALAVALAVADGIIDAAHVRARTVPAPQAERVEAAR
jgi:DNA-binding NarL/FixJ family response regulator